MVETAGASGSGPRDDDFDVTSVKEAASLSTIGVVIGVVIPAILFVLLLIAGPTGDASETAEPAQEVAADAADPAEEDAMAYADAAAEPLPAVPYANMVAACSAADTPAAGDQCNELGIKYLNGDGVAKNALTAVNNFDLGCDKGSMMACANAGMLYGGYTGVSPWPKQSFELLNRACVAGVPHGCAELGLNYQRGIGVTQDIGHARELFDWACAQGWQQGCEYRKAI